MKLVSNGTTNHLECIKDLSLRSDELVFFSPFCFQDFDDFFQEIIHDGTTRVSLVTTLKPEDAVNKCGSMVSFIDIMTARKIKWDLKIDNRLHGKLYFFKHRNRFTGAIVTSANLTENGMRRNHEWGCLLEDESDVRQLFEEAMKGVEIQQVTEEMVIQLMLKVDEYLIAHPVQRKPDLIDIGGILKAITGMQTEAETRLFLKPIGATGLPVLSGDFSKEGSVSFSRRRPNSVRIGDLLICYAVGSTKLISVFRVLSEPLNTNNAADRWPWYVEVRNETPDYGRRWFETDNELIKVTNRYLEAHPEHELTFIGGRTLGALQFGADKIRLNDDFGKYLIGVVERS